MKMGTMSTMTPLPPLDPTLGLRAATVQTAQPQPTGAGAWSGPGAASNAGSAGNPDLVSLDEFMAGLPGSYLMGMDTDLAFLVMCEQIKDADRRIRGMMGEIRAVGAMRDAISKHIDDLRAFRNEMKVAANTAEVGGEHAFGYKPHNDNYNVVMTKHEHLCTRKTFDQDSKTGAAVKGDTNQLIGSGDQGASVADLDAEIKHWENKAQELDQNREIKLVELNSLISKRANALELLSNMEKKKHEAQSSVISNLR